MAKATIQTLWIEEIVEQGCRGDRTQMPQVTQWMGKIKSVWRIYLMLSKRGAGILLSLQKSRNEELRLLKDWTKTAFFHGDECALPRRIPARTWRRHSAFLIYQYNLEDSYRKRQANNK